MTKLTSSALRDTVRQKAKQRVADARDEQNLRVAEERARLAAKLEGARRSATVRARNQTFQHVYYVYDNIVFQVQEDGATTPLFPVRYSALNAAERKAHERAVLDHSQEETRRAASRRELAPQLEVIVERLHANLRASLPERWLARDARLLSFVDSAGTVADLDALFGRDPLPMLPGQAGMNHVHALVLHANALRTALWSVASLPAPVAPREVNAAVSDAAFDLKNDRLIWGRWAAPFHVAAFDPATKTIEVLHERDDPVTSVATDPRTGMIYWMEGNASILRAAPGGAPELFLSVKAPDRGGLWQLDLDLTNDQVFWTNDVSIWSASLSDPVATSKMVISPSESGSPIDLAVDGVNGNLFWIDKDLRSLRRSDLEGRDVCDLFEIDRPSRGLQLDATSDTIYWSDRRGQRTSILRSRVRTPSIAFDGEASFVEWSDLDPGRSFTLELWINPATTRNGQCFIGKHSKKGGNLFLLGIWHDQLSIVLASQTLTFGEARTGMQHLAVVVEDQARGAVVRLYRDGQRLAEQKSRRGINLGGRPWVIGQDWDGDRATDFFLGTVREVRLWEGAHDEGALALNRYRRLEGDEPGLVGLLSAEHARGFVWPDLARPGVYAMMRGAEGGPLVQSVLRLDGQQSHVALPELDLDPTAGVTLEGWVRFEKRSRIHPIVSMRLADGRRLDWRIDATGALSLDLDGYEYVAGELISKQWHHVAATLDAAGDVGLYLDGVRLDAKRKGRRPFTRSDVEALAIGPNTIGRSDEHVFAGHLAEVRVWSSLRTEEQIRASMHVRLDGTAPRLVGVWSFREGRDDVAHSGVEGLAAGKIVDELVEERRELLETNERIADLEHRQAALVARVAVLAPQEARVVELETELALTEQAATAAAQRVSDATDAQQRTATESERVSAAVTELQARQQEVKKRLSAASSKAGLLRQRVVEERIIVTAQQAAANVVKTISRFGLPLPKPKAPDRTKLERLERELAAAEAEEAAIEEELVPIDARMKALLDEQTAAQAAEANAQKELAEARAERRRTRDRLGPLEARLERARSEVETLRAAREEATGVAVELEHQQARKGALVEVVGGDLQTWDRSEVPINDVLAQRIDVEHFLETPGVEGLALVSAEDYWGARRKDALETLEHTQADAVRRHLDAEAQAASSTAAKRRWAHELERDADARREDARTQAASTRKAVTTELRDARANATNARTKAMADRNQRIEGAKAYAAEVKDRTQRQTDASLKAARQRRANAQKDLDAANKARRGH